MYWLQKKYHILLLTTIILISIHLISQRHSITKELETTKYELKIFSENGIKESQLENTLQKLNVDVLSGEEDPTKSTLQQLVDKEKEDHTQDPADDNLCNSDRPEKQNNSNSRKEAFSELFHCQYFDTKFQRPKNGYLKAIDFYHLRKGNDKRENCFLRCVQNLRHNEVNRLWLINSIKLGLPKVVQTLHTNFGFDPLFAPDNELNAIQEGIRSGYAEIVKILSNSNNEMVIDKHGRTITDYVRMKGSPIRPAEATSILGLSVDIAEGMAHDRKSVEDKTIDDTIFDSGWNKETKFEYSERCDLDVVDNEMPQDVFLQEYFETGRPFVLRGHVPNAEKAAFSKNRWNNIRPYSTHTTAWQVGPTAYPLSTGQKFCKRDFTTSEIEDGTECEEMPGVPMISAWHPTDEDFNVLFPMYSKEEFYKLSGWRKAADWFGSLDKLEVDDAWQVSLGGDKSGATFHWHDATFDVLYVGTKEWRLTPPKYKGFTGMSPMDAAEQLDDSYTLHCTQHEGDIIYVPANWGYMTTNHGFTIGAAIILPDPVYKMSNDVINSSKNIVGHQTRAIPFLFVHINKTGGSSMISMFGKYCRREYVSNKWGNGHRSFHSTAVSYIDHYGKDTWNTAYTFAVVRHPLARQVSNYFFLAGRCNQMMRQNTACEERKIQQRVRGSKMNELTDEEKIDAFHEWIQDLYKSFPPTSSDNYLFGSRGHGNEEMLSFNSTQTSWVVDENDKISVDKIFHLESLDENMHKLIKAIPCLQNSQKEKENKVVMEHTNETPKYPDYKLFAKNKRTNQIMKEVFAVDYKNFGYEF